jgi:hypothetical protein
MASDPAAPAVAETVFAYATSLPTVQPATPVVSLGATAALPDLPALASVSNATRSIDSEVGLSLVAVGTNKSVPAPSIATWFARTPTGVLDEMYHQLGTLLSVPLNGYNLGISGEGTAEVLPEVWDPEYFLLDQDISNRA